MSGLTPTKIQDEILGLDDASDPDDVHDAAAPKNATKFTPVRGAKFKQRNRDDLLAEIPCATITRSKRSTRWRTRSASGSPHAQLVANDMVADRRRSRTRHHDADRRADPPARHAGRDPRAAAAAGRAQRRDPRRARLLERPSIAKFTGGVGDACARRCRPRRLRPVPRGTVRPDDHRRPRRGRDQGRARHRRRHAHGEQAVLRLPARQARHRARPQERHAGSRSRCELVAARRHRAPQHDRGRRRASSASATTTASA